MSYNQLIPEILQNTRTIAVVGLSPKPFRTSHQVAEYLQNAGYKIIPVNPSADTVLGEKSYERLTDVKEPVDTVLIFRRSELVPPVVDAAIALKPKYIWMQEGIQHDEAAQKAEAVGIKVIMNRCMLKEHRRR